MNQRMYCSGAPTTTSEEVRSRVAFRMQPLSEMQDRAHVLKDSQCTRMVDDRRFWSSVAARISYRWNDLSHRAMGLLEATSLTFKAINLHPRFLQPTV
jgi:hypothetical protein